MTRKLFLALGMTVCVAGIFAGTNSLVSVTGGRVQTSDVNQYGTALKQDLVPRNSSGTVTDIAGSLGDSTHRWNYAYIKSLNVGTIGSPLVFDSNGINGAYIQTATVTRAKMASLGQQISSNCTSFTTTSTSYVDVTNLSVTITTNGRPVNVFTQAAAGTGNDSSFSCIGNTDTICRVKLVRGSTDLYVNPLGNTQNSLTAYLPANSVGYIDTPAAGTYTYKLQATRSSTATSFTATNIVLVAYEM